jgi:uncharacterized membrane protein
MKTWKEKVFRKSVLFIVGFCSYITLEVCFRGYSYPLMGCCGGILLLLLDPINDKMNWDVDLLLYGLIGSIIITTMELTIGEITKFLGYAPMWDYSNLPLSFDGVICVQFSFLWFLLSILGIFIADAINYYVFEETTLPHYIVFNKLLFTFKEKKCAVSNK